MEIPKAEFQYLTVEKLAELLVGLIRNGAGKAIVCQRFNGETYDIVSLSVSKLPKILTLVSSEEMVRFESEPVLAGDAQTEPVAYPRANGSTHGAS